MRPAQRQKLIDKQIKKYPNKLRTCGDCKVCCNSLSVPDMEPTPKEAHVDCVHLTEKGCGTYETRPQSCKDFYCAWLIGHPSLTGAMRPDRFGIVVWVAQTVHGESYYVDEARQGAFDDPAVKTILRVLGTHRPLAMIHKTGLRRMVLRGKDAPLPDAPT